MTKKIKLDPYLKPFTKTYSRWIGNLTVKGKIIKILEDNIRGYLHDLRLGNNFLNTMQKVLTERKKLTNCTTLNAGTSCS